MPLYSRETIGAVALSRICAYHVADGQEQMHWGGVIAVHTEQDWADIVDLEATAQRIRKDPTATEFVIKRVPGVWFVMDMNGRRNPPTEDLAS